MEMNIKEFGHMPSMRMPSGEVNSYAGQNPKVDELSNSINQIRDEQIMTPADLVKIVTLEKQLENEKNRVEQDKVTSKEAYSVLSEKASVAAVMVKTFDDPNSENHKLDKDPRNGFVEVVKMEKDGWLEATSLRYDAETGRPIILSETDRFGKNTTELRWDNDGNLSDAHIKREIPKGHVTEVQEFKMKREQSGSIAIHGADWYVG